MKTNKLKRILDENYILMTEAKLSYNDIKTLTTYERNVMLDFLK